MSKIFNKVSQEEIEFNRKVQRTKNTVKTTKYAERILHGFYNNVTNKQV